MNLKAPAYQDWPLLGLLYCGTVSIQKYAPMDGMGGGGCISFYSFFTLVPIHTKRDGQDFPVISSVALNWMLLLRFSWKVLDPEWTFRWNFMAFIFTQDQITEIISLDFFVATSGLCLLLGIHHIHWAPVTHPAGLVLDIRLNYYYKVQCRK